MAKKWNGSQWVEVVESGPFGLVGSDLNPSAILADRKPTACTACEFKAILLTPRERIVLRCAASFAQANIDAMNEAMDYHFTAEELDALQRKLL